MAAIEGSNGQVDYNGHTVHLTRDGFAGGASHLEPEAIPITAITEVTVHPPHSLIPGFIHFHTAGHLAPTNYVAAAKDPRTLLFKKHAADQVEQLRADVQSAIDAR